MIFKEKIMLSNCDSVRRLSPDEIKKRLLVVLTFSEGVVLSPNMLIDNAGIDEVLSTPAINNYLNEDGFGKFVVRGPRISSFNSMSDYFDSRADNYIISSMPGLPKKNELKGKSLLEYRGRLARVDEALSNISPIYLDNDFPKDSMKNEINRRLVSDGLWNKYFKNDMLFHSFQEEIEGFESRSDWYEYIGSGLSNKMSSGISINRFRFEVVDSSYNYIYTGDKDAFIQDNIKYLSGLSEGLLVGGISIRTYQDKIENANKLLDKVQFISSLGSDELIKIFTERLIDYLEDKAIDKSLGMVSRKNWFGLYPKLINHMGIEIK